jgi:hypothetical protein
MGGLKMAVGLFYIALILAFCIVAGLIADIFALTIGGVHPWDFC